MARHGDVEADGERDVPSIDDEEGRRGLRRFEPVELFAVEELLAVNPLLAVRFDYDGRQHSTSIAHHNRRAHTNVDILSPRYKSQRFQASIAFLNPQPRISERA